MDKEKEEQLRQKIIEAVPEILELKFGCIIKRESAKITEIVIGEPFSPSICTGCLFVPVLKGKSWGNPEVRTIKIIGRPIQLADVLRAVEKKIGGRKPSYETDVLCVWDLPKDYDQQSDETKVFLYNLLYK